MSIEQSKLKFSQERILPKLVSRPPFYFEGVTMRIFPVRANLATIRQFCDTYINFVPPRIAHYEPFVPFVYICLINYGRMQQIQNVGWVAQNEIAFILPLQWYREVDGKRQFQDFVSFAPFIYVDIEMSEITGREVYGWPKELAFLSRRLNAWASNPRLNSNLLSVERRVSSPDSKLGWTKGAFLDVLRKPTPSFSMVPLQFQNLFNPAAAAARVAWGTWYVFRTLAEVAASSPLRGFSPIQPRSAMAQLSERARRSSVMAAGPFAPWGALQKSLNATTMNLKQFHMARDPMEACYQALVHANMKLERFNRGGLLGDSNVLLGDPTGGFQLRLFRRTAGNLIDALGLEADSEESLNDERAIVLRPVLPFWVDLDLTYGVGTPIGWRVPGEKPTGRRHKKDLRRHKKDLRWRAPDIDELLEPKHKDHGKFRDARAIPWEASIGPYFAPQVAIRVMTLKTDGSGSLKTFCDEYLNAPLESPTKSRFEPWGDRVFLLATNYESMTDGNGKVNAWVHRELAIVVPVVWRKTDDGSVLDVGFVHAFLFADSDIETIMLRERLGLPIVRATLGSPESIWMKGFQPEAEKVPLLTLKTEVQSAFYPGERVEPKTLLEIEVSKVTSPAGTGARSRTDLPPTDPDPEATAAAVALEKHLAFGGSVPMPRFALKEYPDAQNAKRACYQSLIRGVVKLQGKREKIEVVPLMGPGLITVLIDRYPSFPIVETLGLEVNSSTTKGERARDYLVPEEAFWVQSDTTFEREEGYFWSGRRADWKGELPKPAKLPFDPEKVTPGAVVKKWMESLRKKTSPGLSGGT